MIMYYYTLYSFTVATFVLLKFLGADQSCSREVVCAGLSACVQ